MSTATTLPAERPTTPSGRIPTHARFRNLSLTALPDEELDEAVRCCVEQRRMSFLSGVRPRDLRRAQGDIWFQGLLRRMDLMVPHGYWFPAWARMNRQPLPPGTYRGQLTAPVLEMAREYGLRVFFLGGGGDAPFEWARRAALGFRGLILAGAHNPRTDFRDARGEQRLVDRIRATRADIVIARPTSRRGEEFPIRHRRSLGASLYLSLFEDLTDPWPVPGSRRGVRGIQSRTLCNARPRVVLLQD